MSYDPKRDFLSVGGQDFTQVLDGDSAFQYTPANDTITTRQDAGGNDIDFVNAYQGGTGQISVRWDAKTIIKLLSNLKNNKKATSIQRDNRNPGGEKVVLTNVKIINEGQKTKNSDGTLPARTFMFKYEKENVNEGAY